MNPLLLVADPTIVIGGAVVSFGAMLSFEERKDARCETSALCYVCAQLTFVTVALATYALVVNLLPATASATATAMTAGSLKDTPFGSAVKSLVEELPKPLTIALGFLAVGRMSFVRRTRDWMLAKSGAPHRCVSLAVLLSRARFVVPPRLKEEMDRAFVEQGFTTSVYEADAGEDQLGFLWMKCCAVSLALNELESSQDYQQLKKELSEESESLARRRLAVEAGVQRWRILAGTRFAVASSSQRGLRDDLIKEIHARVRDYFGDLCRHVSRVAFRLRWTGRAREKLLRDIGFVSEFENREVWRRIDKAALAAAYMAPILAASIVLRASAFAGGSDMYETSGRIFRALASVSLSWWWAICVARWHAPQPDDSAASDDDPGTAMQFAFALIGAVVSWLAIQSVGVGVDALADVHVSLGERLRSTLQYVPLLCYVTGIPIACALNRQVVKTGKADRRWLWGCVGGSLLAAVASYAVECWIARELKFSAVGTSALLGGAVGVSWGLGAITPVALARLRRDVDAEEARAWDAKRKADLRESRNKVPVEARELPTTVIRKAS